MSDAIEATEVAEQQHETKPDVEVVSPEEESRALIAHRREKAPRGTLALFETDADAETKGIWFQDIASGVELLIAHDDNDNRERYFQQLLRPQYRLAQSNTPEGFVFVKNCIAKSRARYVLLGWRGLTDENGRDIEYSEEFAFKILTDRRYRRLAKLVEQFANDDNSFGLDREDLGKG